MARPGTRCSGSILPRALGKAPSRAATQITRDMPMVYAFTTAKTMPRARSAVPWAA